MYFLEAKREKKTEVVSRTKKITAFLGKVKKIITTKYCQCGAMLCFSDWNNL
jgi:hypothetical protein